MTHSTRYDISAQNLLKPSVLLSMRMLICLEEYKLLIFYIVIMQSNTFFFFKKLYLWNQFIKNHLHVFRLLFLFGLQQNILYFFLLGRPYVPPMQDGNFWELTPFQSLIATICSTLILLNLAE